MMYNDVFKQYGVSRGFALTMCLVNFIRLIYEMSHISRSLTWK